MENLQAYREECEKGAFGGTAAARLVGRERETMIYDGPGWLGNAWRDVKCWAVKGGYEIDVPGIGDTWLTKDGGSIAIAPEPGAEEEMVVEVALGPPLILALAHLDTWCLHGSAVALEDRAVLFLGESGQGKSTLARWLDRNSHQSLRRIGDDILPLAFSGGRLQLLPHFPQLKIAADKQPAAGWPEQIPVAEAYALARPNGEEGIAIKELDAQDGALSLLRHTVAARLFPSELMARHFDFCVQAAGAIRIKELSYPLTPEALPKVFKMLTLDIGTGPFAPE